MLRIECMKRLRNVMPWTHRINYSSTVSESSGFHGTVKAPKSIFDIEVKPLSEHAFGLVVNGKPMKWPNIPSFSVPSSMLAHLIAMEWNTSTLVKDAAIFRPITSLAVRAHDLMTESSRLKCIEQLLAYLKTDTLCFWDSEPPALVNMQRQQWQPIFDAFQSKWSLSFHKNQGIQVKDPEPATISKIHSLLSLMNPYQLAGTELAIREFKSVILGLGLTQQLVSVDHAISAAMLELLYQSKYWGLVEDVHNVELARLHQSSHLALMFYNTRLQ